MTRRSRISFLGASALCLLLCLVSAGCFATREGGIPPKEPEKAAAPDAGARPAPEGIPRVIPIPEAPVPAPDNAAQPPGVPPAPEPSSAPVPAPTPPPALEAAPAGPEAERETAKPAPAEQPPPEQPAAGAPPAPPPAKKTRAAAAPEHEAKPAPPAPSRQEPQPPVWTLQKERLAFRVDFLGITMGYARFQYAGKVSIGGKTAYHINVRAWTSGILSYLYPVNETIEYYLDAETIQPVRIEYTGKKNKRDDVAVYDQENGRIIYRYLDDGKIRKTVEVVPSVHDPVSAIYYYRWRDMGREDRPVNVYGGRKVYQIAARVTGTTRLTTEGGPVDTIVVEPVIRREGKPENKGDLRMWATNDERRIPVRIYGKFRKIREWTLVGELLPERPGG